PIQLTIRPPVAKAASNRATSLMTISSVRSVPISSTPPLQDALVSDLNPRRGSRGLDLGRTAINAQLDPGDVAAVIGGEEHDGVRQLVRRANPAHRHGGHGLLPRHPALLEHGGFDRPGADGVDADLAVPQLGGPTARKRPHGGLAGAVDAE